MALSLGLRPPIRPSARAAANPAQSRERFQIAMTDHGSTILLPNVLERLRRNAPDSELVLSAVGPHTYDEVAAGRIDLILCAEEVPPELENEIVLTSTLSVSSARANE